MKELLLQLLLKFFKNFQWKEFLHNFYFDFVRPELLKLVTKTDNKLDDKTLECLDYLMNKFFK